MGSIAGLERHPGVGNGNPVRYSCLDKPHGQRSLAGYSPQGCKESDYDSLIKQQQQDLKITFDLLTNNGLFLLAIDQS